MTVKEHLSVEEVRAYVNARGVSVEEGRLKPHLLEGCVRCLRLLHSEVAEARRGARWARGLRMPEKGRTVRGFVDLEAIQRQAARIDRQAFLIDAERAVAPELLRELLLLGPEERRIAVRGGGRYGFYALSELLVAECRSECFHDVKRAVDLGELAVESADALSRDPYPPGLVVDALALAWAALGNAHRVRGDLVDAERALLTGRELVQRGSGDRTARAEILSLLGSLRTDQARFDEAVEVLAEATEIWRNEGNREQEGKLLVKLSNAHAEAGETESAVSSAVEARSLFDEKADERLYLVASQVLATWLREAGRIEQARRTYLELEPRFRETIKDPSSLLRLDWLGARLHWSEGDEAGAERELLAIREHYRDRDQTYHYCVVSLDLTTLYLEQGRTQEVRELARQLAPVFASRRVHHHALAALVLFKQAAEAEEVSIGFVRELARYLSHSQKNPYLKFEPSVA
jgi:tetratricopeptide (TPR) repeat protein